MQPKAVIGHCLPSLCNSNGRACQVTERLMMSLPATGCIWAALFGHKDEDAFSHSARCLHNKLTGVESRRHGVDAQAPAAHFHPSLIGHVGRGVVFGVRVPLVNNLRERRRKYNAGCSRRRLEASCPGRRLRRWFMFGIADRRPCKSQ